MKRQVIGVGVALLSGLSVFADLVFQCRQNSYDFPIAFEESVEGQFSNGKTYLLGCYDTDFQKPLGLTLECDLTYTITGAVDNCIYRIDTYNDPGSASFSPKLHFKGVSYNGSTNTASAKYPFCEKLLGAIYIGTWSASYPSGMTFSGEGINTITGPLNTPAVRTEAKSSGDYANAYLYIKSGTFVFSHGEPDADSSYWSDRGQELTDVHAVRFYIEGGSVILKHRKSAYLPYLFKSTTRVYGVERTGFTPGAPVSISCEGLPNYNFSNIYADSEGKVCLWIPAGTYDVSVNDVEEHWTVSGGADDLYGTVSVSGGAITSTGVQIDFRDVINGTNNAENADWWFRVTGDRKYELHLVSGDHTLSGENYNGQVRVFVGPDVEKLTLENLKLGIGSSSAAAIELADEANAEIIVKGECLLKGGLNRPAILVPSAATLTLTAADTNQVLVAQGGGNAAGIGGAFHDSQDSHAPFGRNGADNRYNARCEVGTIIINGGRIEATGGEGTLVVGESGYHSGSASVTGGGAGIGAALFGLANHPIVINGGHVIARGGSAGAGAWGGAGIGCAYTWPWSGAYHVSGKADVESIQIHGGVVDALPGRTLADGTGQAAAIGSANCGHVKGIVIDGDAKVTAWADGDAAAIGAGYSGHAGKIYINGGEVTASASKGAAIGGARNYAPDSPCTVETIIISNGVVNASVSGSLAGAAIGGAYRQAGGRIEIAGGRITATGSAGSAGIGTGFCTPVENREQTVIRITGGTVVARGSKACNGQSCPGIGSGVYASRSGTQHVTDLTITGGSIRSLDAAGNVTPSELVTGDAKRVYRTITLNADYANTRVTALQLDLLSGAIDYGFNGVWTDDAGKLYLWLPESIDVSDTDSWMFQIEKDGQTLSYKGGEVALFSSGVFVDGQELDAYTMGGDGWDWDNSAGVLMIQTSNNLTLSGQSTKSVVIDLMDSESSVTFSDLTLRQGSFVEIAKSPDARTLNLFLSGVNAIETDRTESPAIWVPENMTLVITNAPGAVDAVLTASVPTNNMGSAAIGGQENAGFGTIRIQGGNVIARGGNGSAAIGGGSGSSSSGTVEISGGYVDAQATVGGGAGIGAGADGDFGLISITGGTVESWAAPDGEGYRIGYDLGCPYSSYSERLGQIGITGGSVITGSVYPNPTNGVEKVYAVVLSGQTPGEAFEPDEVKMSWKDEVWSDEQGTYVPDVYNGPCTNYNFSGIVANADGEVNLWLPASHGRDYDFILGTEHYRYDTSSDVSEAHLVTPIYIDGVSMFDGPTNGWSFEDRVLTLKGARDYVLSGSNTTSDVHVLVDVSRTVIASNLVIETNSEDFSPFTVGDGRTVTLQLDGKTSFRTTNQEKSALCVRRGTVWADGKEHYSWEDDLPESHVVTNAIVIMNRPGAEGSLQASSGSYGAAIGGCNGESCGSVTILSGTVGAAAGNLGAGIGGGGWGGDGGLVQIEGGQVTASSGDGAGIGAGLDGEGGFVIITDGTVIAGSYQGAGIGGSVPAYGEKPSGSVRISGGSVMATSDYGAGIGCASDSWRNLSGYAADVVITGGSVTAAGCQKSAAGNTIVDIGGSEEYASAASRTVLLGGSVRTANQRIVPEPTDGKSVLVPTSITGLPESADFSFEGSETVYHATRQGDLSLWLPKDEPILEGRKLSVDGKNYVVTEANNVVNWPQLTKDQVQRVDGFNVQTNVATFLLGGVHSVVWMWWTTELGEDWQTPIRVEYRNEEIKETHETITHWEGEYDRDGEPWIQTDFRPDGGASFGTATGDLTVRLKLDPSQSSCFYRILTDGQANPNPTRYSEITVGPVDNK